jgi:hypothetical protein
VSAKAVGWALEQRLQPAPKIALVVLADCMNNETKKCCPSQRFIAEHVGCSDRTVRTYLDTLESEGLIRRVPRRHPVSGARLSDGYILAVDGPLPEDPSGGDPRKPGLPAPPEEAASGHEPEEEPEVLSLLGASASASEPKRKPVTYNGKRVPKEQVILAERLCEHYAAVTGKSTPAWTRTGDVTGPMKQIIGAIRVRDDVSEERWKRAISNTVANPPEWANGKVQIGTVFGLRAMEHALDNDGGSRHHAVGSSGGDGYAEGARRVAERLKEAEGIDSQAEMRKAREEMAAERAGR